MTHPALASLLGALLLAAPAAAQYVMNRPLHGPLNPTAVDHSTDTYDIIDWLVKYHAPGRESYVELPLVGGP